MKRREFIALVSCAAAWPLAARAQQPSIPVIGYLSGGSPGSFAPFAVAFREGLKNAGYIEGRNVTIEYRWAEGQYERLPSLAQDLVGRKVDVIAASGGDLAARAAKSATATIPIVCNMGDDPVATGLVATLARPGGNLTGTSFLVVELHPKRLELISELVPHTRIVGLLANPNNPQTERVIKAMQEATRTREVQLETLSAATEREIDDAFVSISRRKVDALIVQADPFYVGRRAQLAMLATRYAVPAIYEGGQFVAAGGLMGYGASLTAVYRQLGAYAGRVLKGEKPSDLPVEQPTKFRIDDQYEDSKDTGSHRTTGFARSSR